MSLWIITPKTESVPNLLTLIPQVVVQMDNVNNLNAQKILSPSLDHHQLETQSGILNRLTTKSQYPSVLMLKTGALIQEVSSPIVELPSITVYSLLVTVVTLIG